MLGQIVRNMTILFVLNTWFPGCFYEEFTVGLWVLGQDNGLVMIPAVIRAQVCIFITSRLKYTVV